MTQRSVFHLTAIVVLSMGIYAGTDYLSLRPFSTPAGTAAVVLAPPRSKPRPLPGAPALTLKARAFLSLYISPDGRAEILAERESDEPLPIASLTKLMTARVVAQNYELAALVTIEPEALEGPLDPSLFKAGQVFTIRELVRSLLVESSNWSAQALAGVVGRERFVAEMNRQAKELGLANTYFVNPSGLDPAAGEAINHASARDLAQLARAILTDQPEVFEITRLAQVSLATADGHFHHLALSTDKLLGAPIGQAEIIGGKTGQTDLARKNLLLVLQDQTSGAYLINVVLSSPDHFADMKALTDWLYQSYEF